MKQYITLCPSLSVTLRVSLHRALAVAASSR